ncbi:surface glycoprotein, partial [Natrialba asiatica]|uniref:surface glycoprotein n=1 Tax=Natrialba asiatica TaxID=64602 RepID=UPI00187DB2BC
MTKETTFRAKGRALFLTAMMVLSVVAMTASFAGAAAAANVSDVEQGPVAYEDGNGNAHLEVVFAEAHGLSSGDDIEVLDREGNDI